MWTKLRWDCEPAHDHENSVSRLGGVLKGTRAPEGARARPDDIWPADEVSTYCAVGAADDDGDGDDDEGVDDG